MFVTIALIMLNMIVIVIISARVTLLAIVLVTAVVIAVPGDVWLLLLKLLV